MNKSKKAIAITEIFLVNPKTQLQTSVRLILQGSSYIVLDQNPITGVSPPRHVPEFSSPIRATLYFLESLHDWKKEGYIPPPNSEVIWVGFGDHPENGDATEIFEKGILGVFDSIVIRHIGRCETGASNDRLGNCITVEPGKPPPLALMREMRRAGAIL